MDTENGTGYIQMPENYINSNGVSVFIYGYAFTVLAIVITLLNGIFFSVLSAKRMRVTTNIIMTAIALSNTIHVICPCIPHIYYYAFGNYKEYIPYSFCRMTYYLIKVFPWMFHSISFWLTVELAVVHFVCVVYPFSTSRYCTKVKATASVIVVYVITMLVMLINFIQYDFKPFVVKSMTDPTKNATGCKRVIQEGLKAFYVSYHKTYLRLLLVCESFIPCILLMTFALLMLRYIRLSDIVRAKIQSLPGRSPCEKKQWKSSRRTKSIVTIISIIWCAEMPRAIYWTIEIATTDRVLAASVKNTALVFIKLLANIGYAATFVLYCMLSSRFRKALKTRLTCKLFCKAKETTVHSEMNQGFIV